MEALILSLLNLLFLAVGYWLGSRTHVREEPQVALRSVFQKIFTKGELIYPDNPIERAELDEKEKQKINEQKKWLR